MKYFMNASCNEKLYTSNHNHRNELSQYICGFVDGEGCFSVSYRSLQRLRVGVETRPSFSIAQKKARCNYVLLQHIRDFFGCGAIRDDKKGGYKYETRNLSSILQTIVPFFNQYKLRTTKQKDFIIFSSICSRMGEGKHLHPEGLLQILEDSRALNPSGKRKNSLDVLINRLKKQV